MSDDKITPIREEAIVAEVGGLVDETRVSLAIYGTDLDPDAVSARLGTPPTASHRRDDRRMERSPPSKQGAWFLTVMGKAPVGPNELVRQLLQHFPSAASFWEPLAHDYTMQIRIGIHMDSWNRGFELEPDVVRLAANTGAPINFDLYFDGEDP
jgi:Domain of unknown function (DUF4279)